ncbi:hypothetical protein EAF04_002677 [Stromatinia cepivora]|nr:hypothetical protein EAF04_002677 [Stromatinia cepivora]
MASTCIRFDSRRTSHHRHNISNQTTQIHRPRFSRPLTKQYPELQRNINFPTTILDTIREFSNQTPSEPNSASPIFLPNTWPEQGNFEIKNLSASYTSSTLTLKSINLSIQAGEKIGLCNRSGSGKTSFLSSILRLLEPSDGSIVIDGIDLATIDHKTLRERLLTVPQDAFILQHTIRFNLDPSMLYTDSSIIAALSKVGLWTILQARGGLDGVTISNFLSQEQKQLFALARAILVKEHRSVKLNVEGGILLLDEATSNIDRDTDAIIQKVIREVFKKYTILVIAHRLDTIMGRLLFLRKEGL